MSCLKKVALPWADIGLRSEEEVFDMLARQEDMFVETNGELEARIEGVVESGNCSDAFTILFGPNDLTLDQKAALGRVLIGKARDGVIFHLKQEIPRIKSDGSDPRWERLIGLLRHARRTDSQPAWFFVLMGQLVDHAVSEGSDAWKRNAQKILDALGITYK